MQFLYTWSMSATLSTVQQVIQFSLKIAICISFLSTNTNIEPQSVFNL